MVPLLDWDTRAVAFDELDNKELVESSSERSDRVLKQWPRFSLVALTSYNAIVQLAAGRRNIECIADSST